MSANLQNWVPSSSGGLASCLATLPIKVLLPQNLSADLSLSFPSFLLSFLSPFLPLSPLYLPSLPSFPAIMKKCRNQTKTHYSFKLLGNNLKDHLLQYFLMWNFFNLETHSLVIILTQNFLFQSQGTVSFQTNEGLTLKQILHFFFKNTEVSFKYFFLL